MAARQGCFSQVKGLRPTGAYTANEKLAAPDCSIAAVAGLVKTDAHSPSFFHGSIHGKLADRPTSSQHPP